MSPIFRTAVKVGVLICSLFALRLAHAQQEGVDCMPIQGQGWTGCVPIGNGAQRPVQPQSPPLHWISQWGALATDEPKGILGATTGRASMVEARQAALDDCSARGGSPCKLEIAYDNACVALVAGTKDYSIDTAATPDAAQRLAMKICSADGDPACHVYYSACSLPRPVQ